MQDDFAANFPSLKIQILGVNENDVGDADANAAFCANRDTPFLQDVDANNNQRSDVWYDLWNVTYRDVIILNTENEIVDVFNLTTHGLESPMAPDRTNFEALRQSFIDTAKTPPKTIWQSPIEPLDVNRDELITPLDALLVINALGEFAGGALPEGGPNAEFPDYVDVTGTGSVAPLDALLVINQLTFNSCATPRGFICLGIVICCRVTGVAGRVRAGDRIARRPGAGRMGGSRSTE